ncbi:hypothetical protein Pla108_25980 [Botrimarina colliarenosi]|uniref:Uncharacterized protein n=1 Tax=Botrimarina colliarenosi TaxID=2528001 RepID=A0A5C6A9Y6_9BACT|nr:DUF5522 domain-containing protein [Botrimarina colliarenosi]TWT96824.1 hypothetical protein Pla108_25980 [Botrimarina colliarenosi]
MPDATQRNALQPGADYYVERGGVVFTAAFLARRGVCCDNGCRHCPYRQVEPSALAAGGAPIDAVPGLQSPHGA